MCFKNNTRLLGYDSPLPLQPEDENSPIFGKLFYKIARRWTVAKILEKTYCKIKKKESFKVALNDAGLFLPVSRTECDSE